MYIHKAYASFPGTFFFNNEFYNPPIISFYGLQDHYLEPGLEPQIYAPASATYKNITGLFLQTETNCLGACPSTGKNYTLSPSGVADAYSAGSEKIYSMLVNKNIATLLYKDCQMGHGLDANCSATGCYKSEFGTGVTTKEDTYKYIAARAANFFQVVLQYGPANTYTGVTKFTECEDKRHLCGRGNTNGCSNGNTCPANIDEEEVF